MKATSYEAMPENMQAMREARKTEDEMDNLTRERLPVPSDFDEATRRRIVKAIEEGLSNVQLRDRFRISQKTVDRFVEEYEIKRPNVYARQWR